MRVRRGRRVRCVRRNKNMSARMCGITTLAFRAHRSRYPDLLRKSGASRDVELDPFVFY